jgi:phosphatidylserine/phosphatidylglycerophosphate/cardiolipin synthase-like enzyme
MKLIIFSFLLLTSVSFSQVVDIANLRINDSSGIPVNIGQTFTVSGIVTCSDQFDSPSNIQDATGGISVFGNSFISQVSLGDLVTVTSTISHFNGLTQFDFTSSGSSVTIHSNTQVPEPTVLTINDITTQQWDGFEAYEGLLIRINNVTISGSGNFIGSTNYNITDPTGTLFSGLRVDNNVSSIIGSIIPSGQVDIIGILGQYDTSPPYSTGYQLQPRFIQDIVYDGAPLILTPVYASDIDINSFTVYFSTARKGNSQVKYGLTPSLELDSVIVDTDTTEHEVQITGLQSSTLYYFKAYSTNDIGTSSSALYSVRTAALNPTTGTINVYFNFPVDTTVAIPGNSAKGNVNFQDKLVERINHANYSIDLALYSFSGMQEVADALVLAKNRGVKIRVVYDHRYPDYPIQNSMQALINNGIQISQRPPETQAFPGIMHNKFIIFDARDTVASNDWLWTGSWNVTSTELNWKNNVIEINDPSITSAYTTEFEEMWGSNTDTPNSSNAKFGYQKTDNTLHNFNIGGIDIQSYFSPSDGTTNKIISQINGADYSLYLALYVITRDDIRNTIVTRTNNGMSDLRGIVEDIDAPGSEFFTLQSYGEFFQSPSPTLHHKYGIIDASYTESEPTTVTGSHNWSSAAENDNDENTLIIKDVYITNQYMQEFKKRYNEAGGTGTFIIPVVEIEDEENTISDFSYRLYQNYPNPFNPVTTIRFEIPYSQYVELTLYDVLGRKVRTLFEGEVPAGIVAIDFSSQSGSAPVGKGGSLASGVYIYRIKTKDFTASKKLILLK